MFLSRSLRISSKLKTNSSLFKILNIKPNKNKINQSSIFSESSVKRNSSIKNIGSSFLSFIHTLIGASSLFLNIFEDT